MTKQLITLAVACSLFSIGSIAYAGKPCPFDDKQLPEKSKVCKAGTIQQCTDGQWKSLGIKCTSKFREDERVDASGVRRGLGEPRLQRDRIVARIAPAS